MIIHYFIATSKDSLFKEAIRLTQAKEVRAFTEKISKISSSTLLSMIEEEFCLWPIVDQIPMDPSSLSPIADAQNLMASIQYLEK